MAKTYRYYKGNAEQPAIIRQDGSRLEGYDHVMGRWNPIEADPADLEEITEPEAIQIVKELVQKIREQRSGS